MKSFIIEQNDSEQRLDKFLKKLFKNATRSLLFKFNRKWKIKVNWKKEDNEYKLQIWDEVKIFLRDEEFDELSKDLAPVVELSEKLDKKDVAYEDNDLLIVNKNPYLNVHPWDHKTKEVSLIEQVHDYLWNSLNSLTFKPALAHRIDRDTSGCVIIWKQKHVLDKLVSDFKNKKIKKTYFAIVIWKLPKRQWKIDSKLLRIEDAKNENKVQVSSEWKPALTTYKVLEELTLKTKEWPIDISCLEVGLETWRMHQIRVHLASIWNPIIWDSKYWDLKLNHYLQKEFWIWRQLLHSHKIEFFHKWREKTIEIEARLKKDMADFIEICKK